MSQRYSFNNLFYEVSRRCNLACPQCMAGSADPQRVAESVERELSADEIERYVLGTASEIGIETITWSGGEFIFREDHLEILRRATRHGYSSIVTTNATLMTREKRGKNSPLINVDGVKIYMDGVPNDAPGGAAMIDPYATSPTFGTPSIDESTFSTWMLRFDAEGLKVMAHATGSLGPRHFLNALEATE